MHRSHVFCTTTSHFSWYTVLCCFCPSHVSTSSVFPEGRKLCIGLTFLCNISSHFSWYTVLCCFCHNYMYASSVLPEGRKLCIDLTCLTIGTITSHFLSIQCCVASAIIICVRKYVFSSLFFVIVVVLSILVTASL